MVGGVSRTDVKKNPKTVLILVVMEYGRWVECEMHFILFLFLS